mgnify:CR=1 FL=1
MKRGSITATHCLPPAAFLDAARRGESGPALARIAGTSRAWVYQHLGELGLLDTYLAQRKALAALDHAIAAWRGLDDEQRRFAVDARRRGFTLRVEERMLYAGDLPVHVHQLRHYWRARAHWQSQYHRVYLSHTGTCLHVCVYPSQMRVFAVATDPRGWRYLAVDGDQGADELWPAPADLGEVAALNQWAVWNPLTKQVECGHVTRKPVKVVLARRAGQARAAA